MSKQLVSGKHRLKKYLLVVSGRRVGNDPLRPARNG